MALRRSFMLFLIVTIAYISDGQHNSNKGTFYEDSLCFRKKDIRYINCLKLLGLQNNLI